MRNCQGPVGGENGGLFNENSFSFIGGKTLRGLTIQHVNVFNATDCIPKKNG